MKFPPSPISRATLTPLPFFLLPNNPPYPYPSWLSRNPTLIRDHCASDGNIRRIRSSSFRLLWSVTLLLWYSMFQGMRVVWKDEGGGGSREGKGELVSWDKVFLKFISDYLIFSCV